MNKAFILAGNATFTLRNKLTGNHFTYKVRQPKEDTPHFVSLLRGPDNTSDYTFIGTIFDEARYVHSKKSRVGHNAMSVKAFEWTWSVMQQGNLPSHIELMHAGKCGRCARKLTDPVSISTGFGPHCRSELGVVA